MTLKIAIPAGEWTQVNSDLVGTVSNFGERDIHLRESVLEPSSDELGGVVLRPSVPLPFSLADTFNLWARPKPADTPEQENTNVFVATGINSIMDSELRDLWLVSFETSNTGNTAVKTFIQDQTSQSIDLEFTQDIGTTTLDGIPTRDERFFDVASAAGISLGNLIEIGDASAFIRARVLGIVSNTIEIDSPMTRAFADESVVTIKTDNLLVDGSTTPQVFAVSPEAQQNGDITRLIVRMEASATMDSGTFGPIPALRNGCVIRVKEANGDFRNLINFKSNGEFISHCFDNEFLPNNGQGIRLVTERLTYAGQSKHGVTQRINGALLQEIQIVIQDDLSQASFPSFLEFAIANQGHEVQP